MNGVSDEQIIRFLLDYEVRGAGWPHYITDAYLQELAGRYFAWKVRRKLKRLRASLSEAELVKAFRAHPHPKP